MSDIILISKVGLYETVKCAICENPNQSDRGCDGSCQYDKELHEKIVEAVEGIAEQRPHGKWEFIGDNLFKCTNCGYVADADYLRKWKVHTYDAEFPTACLKCGADMRKR